jgi:hypothetical protein
MEKSFKEQELDRLKFTLRQIEERGLEFYEFNEALVLEYVKKGLKREIQELEDDN